MNVLVTGAAGFMGSHLVDELLARGHTVVGIDDLSGGFVENVHPKCDFVQCSINDEQSLRSLFRRIQFDVVYHLAAYAAEGLSHFIKRFNYQNNLIGSVNLINNAVNFDVPRFVFTSSIAVYGKNQLPMTEELIPQPEDSYGIAKLAVEQELRCSHEVFDLEYIIFRPHNVYGDRQNVGDRYRNVAGIFMNQILRGKPLTIFGDGSQTRAFTYIKDAIPAMVDVLDFPAAWNQVFNIGADEPYTVNELANMVCKVMGVERRIEYLEPRKEVQHPFADHSKLKRVIGYKSRFSLEEGLPIMAESTRQPRKSAI